jgi:hemerythrin-like domain-containing protein
MHVLTLHFPEGRAMKPTEILSSEHRIIEQVMNCLEAIVRQAKEAGRLDGQSAKDAIAFFRNFADRCHHGKEEVHLFPALEAKGFPREGGPTGVMLHEHEEGRAHVRGMDDNLAAAAAGDPAALQQFIAHAEGYVSVLREHIYKEDHILFQLADRALTAEDQKGLLAAFGRVEAEEMGAGTHETYLKIAEDLSKRYGVTATATAAPAGHFHCGHTQ